MPHHPFCPEVLRFSLVPTLSFMDGIDIARRQATSMSLDDITLKFPPVKTRREKWETSGEHSHSVLRRHVELHFGDFSQL